MKGVSLLLHLILFCTKPYSKDITQSAPHLSNMTPPRPLRLVPGTRASAERGQRIEFEHALARLACMCSPTVWFKKGKELGL
ncbi:hypothetical protein V8C37DRAFT_377718 [Trichoderma ceciliae]